jgi:hypothetical protein
VVPDVSFRRTLFFVAEPEKTINCNTAYKLEPCGNPRPKPKLIVFQKPENPLTVGFLKDWFLVSPILVCFAFSAAMFSIFLCMYFLESYFLL